MEELAWKVSDRGDYLFDLTFSQMVRSEHISYIDLVNSVTIPTP